MRSTVIAVLLSAALAACSGDAAPEAEETDGSMETDAGENLAEAPETTQPETPARETVSGTLAYIALDHDPAIAQIEGEDILMEIAPDAIDPVLDEWGGVGTPLSLDCAPSEPFTGEEGVTYTIFTDCRLPG